MRTYSALRSQVQTVEDARPAPRLTPTVRSVPLRYSAACGAASSCGRPSWKSTIEPIVTAARDSSKATPAGPPTAMGGPQLGPPPGYPRLPQGRFRDRLCRLPRLGRSRAAGDVHGDELGRALAAADDA